MRLFWEYGFSIAVDLIAIMIAVSGISLGIGYAFNEKRLKEFGRQELFQSIFNGILVGCLLALFSTHGIIGNLITALTQSKGTSFSCSEALSGNPAICFAYNYLVGIGPYTFMGQSNQSVLSVSTELITGLLGLNAIIGIVAGIKINIFVISISLASVLSPIINEIQYIIRILADVSISAIVQASLLMFVSVSSITAILPTGLILRSFLPTRKIGGFLISLSIGFYVVFPLTYVFNAALISSYSGSISNTSIGSVSINASNLENTLLSVNPGTNESLSRHIASLASGIEASLAGMMNGIMSDVAYLLMYAFILPAFSLILTAVSIREIASLLGSEVFFGRFRLL